MSSDLTRLNDRYIGVSSDLPRLNDRYTGVSSDLPRGVSFMWKAWVTCWEIWSWKQVLSFHGKDFNLPIFQAKGIVS